MDLSVVIITFNEEENIARCLASLPSGAELIVLDSNSSDRTKEIAKEMGALVFTRPFTDFSAQKNAALSKASRSWILIVDADEALDAKLCQAIVGCIKEQGQYAYKVQRKLIFLGRKLRFGKSSDCPIRLFPRGSALYCGSLHEKLEFKQKLKFKQLEGELLHYSYKDITDYFNRFNRYTSLSGVLKMQKRAKVSFYAKFLHVLRPFWEFFSRYFLRFGFLDGYAGYTYALYSSIYAFTKYAKYLEQKNKKDD